MYSNIQDCDEGTPSCSIHIRRHWFSLEPLAVYNYWEPLHYLQHGSGFQTWETSPKYSIRSWAYILLHWPLAQSITFFLSDENKVCSSLNTNASILTNMQRRSFFAVRAALAFFSAFCDAKFFRSVGENVNDHIARYMIFMLFSSPGMWIASTGRQFFLRVLLSHRLIPSLAALLPSTFSMYFTTLALSFSMKPASQTGYMRTLAAVVSFAVSAVVGWPFALLLAVPFVFEELFVSGGDLVPAHAQLKWRSGRWTRMLLCGLIASFIIVSFD